MKLGNGNIRINNLVFWPPMIMLLISIILSLFNFETFTGVVSLAFYWITENFGWLFSLSSFVFVVILVIVFLSPVGKIKFGGENAKPKISTWNWFAMSLTAGIGFGLVFFAVAEPIYHFASPPATLGIEAFSEAAALFSMSAVFLHWSFSPYALYAIIAIPIALAYYNYNQPFAVSSSLYFIMGDKCHGGIGKAVDALCLFAIAGGTAAILGGGIMQIGSGLNYVFGIQPSVMVWIITAIIIVAAYTVSSYTGLEKGIKFLADKNTKIFLALMLFILVVGPTTFIFKLLTQSIGVYFQDFITLSLFTSPLEADTWPVWWSIFYWAIWMSFAPIIALFLARIVYGRTVRQFIAINLVAPAVFAFLWFGIFGGAAIKMQVTEQFNIWENITTRGLEDTTFAFLSNFPLGVILVPVFLITIVLSFVTLADSMTSTISLMSTRGLAHDAEEAPAFMKVLWGVVIGIIALIMIVFAGVDGIKMLSTLAGFPIMLLMIAIAVSAVKGLWLVEPKPSDVE